MQGESASIVSLYRTIVSNHLRSMDDVPCGNRELKTQLQDNLSLNCHQLIYTLAERVLKSKQEVG